MAKKQEFEYFVLPVFGCVDPQTLVGPFADCEQLKVKAREIKEEQDEEDAIFWVATKEKQLRDCIQDLLDTCELNLDELEPETRKSIRAALRLLKQAPTTTTVTVGAFSNADLEDE